MVGGIPGLIFFIVLFAIVAVFDDYSEGALEIFGYIILTVGGLLFAAAMGGAFKPL